MSLIKILLTSNLFYQRFHLPIFFPIVGSHSTGPSIRFHCSFRGLTHCQSSVIVTGT